MRPPMSARPRANWFWRKFCTVMAPMFMAPPAAAALQKTSCASVSALNSSQVPWNPVSSAVW